MRFNNSSLGCAVTIQHVSSWQVFRAFPLLSGCCNNLMGALTSASNLRGYEAKARDSEKTEEGLSNEFITNEGGKEQL